MMKAYLFAVCSLTALLSGCADDVETETMTLAPITRVEYRIDGVAAEDFYSQFTLKSLNSCAAQKSFLGLSAPPQRIAVNQYGQDVSVQLTLLLGLDRKYALLYQETQIVVGGGGWVRQTITRAQVIRGAWNVVEDRLVLSDFGEASGGRYDSRAIIEVQARRNVLHPGLEGKRFLLAPLALNALFADDMDPCRSPKY